MKKKFALAILLCLVSLAANAENIIRVGAPIKAVNSGPPTLPPVIPPGGGSADGFECSNQLGKWVEWTAAADAGYPEKSVAWINTYDPAEEVATFIFEAVEGAPQFLTSYVNGGWTYKRGGVDDGDKKRIYYELCRKAL
jgi:hypothetical protein